MGHDLPPEPVRQMLAALIPHLKTADKTADKTAGKGAVQSAAPVSYTHLRAHETVLDLVCRLLLEKKKLLINYYSL